MACRLATELDLSLFLDDLLSALDLIALAELPPVELLLEEESLVLLELLPFNSDFDEVFLSSLTSHPVSLGRELTFLSDKS